MRAKHWLALFLVMAMAASLAIIPTTAEENLLQGSGDLIGSTVTFSVAADRETVVYTGQEEVITFTVDVDNDSNYELHAFSFMLEPSAGLTLATGLKDDGANRKFYFDYPDDTPLRTYYKTFDYSYNRLYFGAAKADKTNTSNASSGSGIVNTRKTVLTIMGKVNAAGDYTLTMNTTDRDKVVVAGQVNGSGDNTTSSYFRRIVKPATVTVVAGGVISGTVKDDADQPMGGAAVTLKDSKGDVAAETVADESGSYTLPAVANGDYTLDVTAQVEEKTLRGSGSVTVDQYAVDAGSITVRQYQLGDVNKDGTIDIRDVQRLYNHILGREIVQESDLSIANTNNDDVVDIRDVQRLFDHVLGRDLMF